MDKTYEGTIFNGQVRFLGDVELPENTHVYVVVPDTQSPPKAHIATPRLVHPEQTSEFQMEVIEGASDAGV